MDKHSVKPFRRSRSGSTRIAYSYSFNACIPRGNLFREKSTKTFAVGSSHVGKPRELIDLALC
ncbi:hypothetical protein Poly59_04090 [Rubripirellula reticaptiva]|uniref:Uncharacterized protein n=1 Tax=Rubripirellula reticaptiva TaxID=2528013 RepID=A0A5C6F9F1_9BACT|nr:hypothetical protein Poly59_04090 [Rubripirellula reticaptiva]